MSQDQTQQNVEIKPEVVTDPIQIERTRLAELLFNKAPFMTAEYKILINHTGSLLSASMTYAYSKGLQDALKLILKENNTNVKTQNSET